MRGTCKELLPCKLHDLSSAPGTYSRRREPTLLTSTYTLRNARTHVIHTIRNFKEKNRYKNILLMFLNDYFYSCVCMYLYMCTYLQVSVHVCIVCVVYMHMCTCECGHWRMMLGIFNHSPPYILRQGLSLDLDLSNFTELSLTSESPPSSQHRDRRVTPPCCFFFGCWVQTQVPHACMANSFPAEPFPQIPPQLSPGKVAVIRFCAVFHHCISQALAPSQSAPRTNSVWEGQTDW